MTIYSIVTLPDKRLRVNTKPITVFDEALQTLIADMFESMYAANGVGLAATQIGLDIRIAVIDVEGDKKNQYVLINPKVTMLGEAVKMHEGCLSVPHVSAEVKRATRVKLHALDGHGKPYELEASDLLAECIQHEVDHLNGKLYIDLLSPLKRDRLIKKMDKVVRSEHM
ncbi:MAG TPA: peptide deformylase [Gammaproteobacteria bacterium]|nr:peptide deformylase [Gammaproteobacteria bacterium]